MARIKPALVQRHSDPLSADFATQALCQLAGIQYQVALPPHCTPNRSNGNGLHCTDRSCCCGDASCRRTVCA